MKFKTQFNSDEFPKRYEKPIGVSKTIPDQSMSVREIMERYARGLPVTGARVPIYDGDDDGFMPDPATLDIAERHELMQDVKDEINEINSRVKSKKTKKSKEDIVPPKQLDIEDAVVIPPDDGEKAK